MDDQPPSPALDIVESQIFAYQSASGEVGRRPDCSSRRRRPSPARQGAYIFASRQPCVVCGRTPADPHHLRFAQPRAFGRKVSDGYTGPVVTHHRELHGYGDEASSWEGVNVDPVPIALGLWQRTRPDWGLEPTARNAGPVFVSGPERPSDPSHLERRAERPRLISFCRRGPLDGFKADPPS